MDVYAIYLTYYTLELILKLEISLFCNFVRLSTTKMDSRGI